MLITLIVCTFLFTINQQMAIPFKGICPGDGGSGHSLGACCQGEPGWSGVYLHTGDLRISLSSRLCCLPTWPAMEAM